jgi:hypothetical protein
MEKPGLRITALLFILSCWGPIAQARFSSRGGSAPSLFDTHSVGAGLNYVNVNQDDLNTHLGATAATKRFENAWELDVNYQYRFFDSPLAFQFRPSYFLQDAKDGSYDYKLSGYTLFPVLKIFFSDGPDSKFYTLLGFGYGSLKGEISQPTGSLDFEGSSYGAMAGIGGEICERYHHCFSLELIARYLPIEKSTVRNLNGIPTGLTQYSNGREIEYNGKDIQTEMTGIMIRLGYQYSLDWLGFN